ncbi:hypothetical protein EDB84DRAFT_1505061, partial [Lactarius hengduanensis]
MGKGGPTRTGQPGASCPRAPPFRTKGRVVSGATGRGGGMPSRAPLPREWGRMGAGALAYPFPHVPGQRGQWGRVASGGVPSHARFLRVRGGAAKGEGEVLGASCPRAPLHGKGGAGERGRGRRRRVLVRTPSVRMGGAAKGEGVGGAEGRDSGVPSCPLVPCEWEGRRRGERERWAVQTGGREN